MHCFILIIIYRSFLPSSPVPLLPTHCFPLIMRRKCINSLTISENSTFFWFLLWFFLWFCHNLLSGMELNISWDRNDCSVILRIPCCCRGSTSGPPWCRRISSRWCWWWGGCWRCQMTGPPLVWFLSASSVGNVWTWSGILEFPL